MAGGGLKSHFRSGKASLSALRTGKEALPPSERVEPTASAGKQKPSALVQHVPDPSFTIDATDPVAQQVGLAQTAKTRGEGRTRSTRTQLRTPKQGEVERILAEIESQGTPNLTAGTEWLADGTQRSERAGTPPPPVPDPSSPYLLGTPPRSVARRNRGATVSPTKRFDPGASPSLFDARRTDTGVAKRKARDSQGQGEAVSGGALHASPTKVSRVGSSSDGFHHARSGLPLLQAETPALQQLGGERHGPDDNKEDDPSDDDGLVLTPGRNMGMRVSLGSPKAPVTSPLATQAAVPIHPRTLAKRIMEDEDDTYLTPRSVRERPKGHVPQLLPVVGASATFQSATSTLGSRPAVRIPAVEGPASSTAPSLSTPSLRWVEKKKETEPSLPSLKHVLSTDLPLPKHYSSLMTLHVALEHALVVHLATSGASMASLDTHAAASTDESSDEADPPSAGGEGGASPFRLRRRTVRLPNLVTYTAIRPLVERSGGRRLGPTELARLASVWVDFRTACSSATPTEASEAASLPAEEAKGLGFIISRTRTLDPKTGRKVWDWGIGIELEVKRPRRPRTPPVQVEFGGIRGAPSTPGGGSERARFTTPPLSPVPSQPSRWGAQPGDAPLTPSSPSKRKREASTGRSYPSPQLHSSPRPSSSGAREGMSIVAMWNNGIEVRKAEVGRRLRERCGRFHQLWLDEKGIIVPQLEAREKVATAIAEPATPSRMASGRSEDDGGVADGGKKGRATLGEGGLWTPSATRSGARRPGGRTINFDQERLDRDALLDSDVSADEGEGEGEGSADAQVDAGRKALMAELQHTPTQHEQQARGRQRTAPAAKLEASSTVAIAEEASSGWQVPHEGMVLHEWHPEFDRDNATVVRPVPTVELPSLRDPAPGTTSVASTPTTGEGRHVLLPGFAGQASSGSGLRGLGLENPSTPHRTPSTLASARSDSVLSSGSGSGMSLKDRIRQKEEAKRHHLLAKSNSSTSLLSRATPGTPSSTTPTHAQMQIGTPTRGTFMATLQRRSTLSRLPEIAGIVYVIFTSSSSSSAGAAGAPTRTPTLPMADIITRLSKSVKTTMSRAECRDAIEILREEVDGFLEVVRIGGKEWVKMGRREGGAVWGLQEVRERIGAAIARG